MGKIVIPKNTATLDEVIGAMKIYYDNGGWIENADYINEYKRRYGVLGDDTDKSAYTKKTEIGAYYGFIEWEDITNKRSPRRITNRGRLFLEHYETGDTESVHEDLMKSLEEITFGRNNYACQTCDSDIEPPALFIRAVIDLNYLTNTEFAYLVYRIEYDGKHYTDIIREIRSKRDEEETVSLVEEANKYKDPKPILILERFGVLDSIQDGHQKKTIIEKSFYKKYERRLRALKIYNIDKTNAQITDNDSEKNDDGNDVLNHNLYGIHITEKNNALSEDNPHICLGWSKLGDLTSIIQKEALYERYENVMPEDSSHKRGQNVGQLWRFKHEAQVGDYIIYAERDTFHIGIISSDYYFDESETLEQFADYKNTRKVNWLKTNINRSILSETMNKSLSAGMSFFGLNDYKSVVAEILEGTYIKDIPDGEEEMIEYNAFKPLVYSTGINKEIMRNRIFFGAPGTGKSHDLNDERKLLLYNNKNFDESIHFDQSLYGSYERITFHPDYTYANFVGTYKPVPSTDGISYEYVPGPFMRVYVKAMKDARDKNENAKPHILVIEEINRANVAAVFGEVFQLLDRKENVSEYPIQPTEDMKVFLASSKGLNAGKPDDYREIKIPDNMFIWATMNSADQGVFPMDTAFKRRWDFAYLGIDKGESDIKGKSIEAVAKWKKYRKAINNRLVELKINEDKLLGPFFVNEDNLESIEAFNETFKHKVLMYLFEDAAKQKRNDLFVKHNARYSELCAAYDAEGIKIFKELDV